MFIQLQKKHRLAIQIYKKCLQQDFGFLLPLFQISVEYRNLNLFDAEIESLALLTKALFYISLIIIIAFICMQEFNIFCCSNIKTLGLNI